MAMHSSGRWNPSRPAAALLCALAALDCRARDSACGAGLCQDQGGANGDAAPVDANAGGAEQQGGAEQGAAAGTENIAGMENSEGGSALSGDGGSGAESVLAVGGTSNGGQFSSAGTSALGGAPGAGACQADADCVDTLGCNGQERCVSHQCRAGTPLECGADLHCVEHGAGAASCDYAAAGRWLTFLGNDTGNWPFELRAVRLEGATHRASISLSSGVVDNTYQLIGTNSWSPDGRHLILSNAKDLTHLDTNRLFLVNFGDGLPAAPQPLKDIPVGSITQSGPWSLDSSAVFVESSGTAEETYVVRFSPQGMQSSLLFRESDENSSLDFCPDTRWLFRSVGEDTKLVDSQHPAQERLLWQGSARPSPDHHWIMGSNDDTGIWYAACAAGAQPVHLGSVAPTSDFSWSKDGRFVALTHGFDDDEIEVLDSAHGFASVYKAAMANYHWAPGSSRLMLLGAADAHDTQIISEVNFGVSPVKASKRAETPHPSAWGFMDDNTLWASRDAAAGLSEFWLLEKGSAVWRQVANQLSDASPAFTPDYAVFKQTLTDGTSQLLAFSLHSEQPMAIPLLPTPVSGELSREGFYAGGLLAARYSAIAQPFQGQIWWLSGSPSGFGKPVLLNDVKFGASVTLQPAQ